MGERAGRAAPLKMVWFFCCLGFLLTATLLGAIVGAGNFVTVVNFRNIMMQFSTTSLLAFGMALTFATGCLDVSQAGVGALVSVIVATMVKNGSGEGAAVVCALLVGIAVGSLNGLFAALFRRRTMLITAFISAGSLYFLRGVALQISEGMTIPLSGGLQFLSSLARGGYAPYIGLLLCALPFVLFLVTRSGKFLFHASEVGERDRRTGGQRFWACFLSGLFAAVAGILLTGRLGAGMAMVFSGQEFTLLAILLTAGVAIPNLAHRRGEAAFGLGSVMIAALSMAMWNNMLVLAGVNAFVQTILTGAIIVLFAIVNALFCLSMRLPSPTIAEGEPQPYPHSAPVVPVAPVVPIAQAAPVAPVVPAAPAEPDRKAETFAEIGRLYDLFAEGKLSKEDFEERKRELLAGL